MLVPLPPFLSSFDTLPGVAALAVDEPGLADQNGRACKLWMHIQTHTFTPKERVTHLCSDTCVTGNPRESQPLARHGPAAAAYWGVTLSRCADTMPQLQPALCERGVY